jgi:flagellar basal body-associated protein FliL
MKNKKRILTAMIAVILCISLFPVTAFAGGGEEIPLVPEVTEKPKTDSAPLTPDGNLTLVDDVTTETTESKQFVTLVSKNGNYFYLVIDRAGNKENVYFLNLVDEADLLALIEDENPKKTQPSQICTCTDLCENGKVDPNCSLCRNDLTKCTGKTTAPTPAPEPKEEKSKSMGGVLLFLIIAMIGGGAFYYFRFQKNKPNTKGSTALEEYDFDEDDENAEEEYEEEYQSDDDVEESEGDNQ